MTLGEKIQKLRKVKGMSQEQLAAQLTVSRQAVSKWELSESMPETENVIQLSKLFRVSTDYLLHDDIEADTDIPVVRESCDHLTQQYNRKLWLVLIGTIIVISVVVGITTESLVTITIGIVYIGIVYLISLVIKALRKYTSK